MKLNRNWWCAVDWNDFDNEQRRKTVLWLERLHRKNYPFCDVPEDNLLKPYIWGVPVSSNDDLPKVRMILSS